MAHCRFHTLPLVLQDEYDYLYFDGSFCSGTNVRKLKELQKQIACGREITKDVVRQMMILEADIMEEREADEGISAYLREPCVLCCCSSHFLGGTEPLPINFFLPTQLRVLSQGNQKLSMFILSQPVENEHSTINRQTEIKKEGN